MIYCVFFMLFLLALGESPLMLIFSLMGLSLMISVVLFFSGVPMISYMWVLVYIGGMMIVFTYVVFFSLNSWLSPSKPLLPPMMLPGGLFLILNLTQHSLLLSLIHYTPQWDFSGLDSIFDFIMSMEMSWGAIKMIFILMCYVLLIILQLSTMFSTPNWKIFSF